MTLIDSRTGNELPPDVQKRILEKADNDSDQHLSFTEFQQLVCYSLVYISNKLTETCLAFSEHHLPTNFDEAN